MKNSKDIRCRFSKTKKKSKLAAVNKLKTQFIILGHFSSSFHFSIQPEFLGFLQQIKSNEDFKSRKKIK